MSLVSSLDSLSGHSQEGMAVASTPTPLATRTTQLSRLQSCWPSAMRPVSRDVDVDCVKLPCDSYLRVVLVTLLSKHPIDLVVAGGSGGAVYAEADGESCAMEFVDGSINGNAAYGEYVNYAHLIAVLFQYSHCATCCRQRRRYCRSHIFN